MLSQTMFKGDWAFFKKTLLGFFIILIPVLIFFFYMLAHNDYEGFVGVFALFILISYLILSLIAISISLFVSYLRIVNKKRKGKLYSGTNKWILLVILLIVSFVAGFVVW